MTRILAVTSGKGGVGKTHLSVNLALHCARKGQRVCLFDADLGLANVSLLFKLYPERNLSDVIAGTCRLRDIVLSSCGIDIVPGSSGVTGMADLPPAVLARLGAEFSTLNQYDVLIFDTSAGVADNLLALVAAAPETLLVITPEPTALTDAYALVKLLQRRGYAGQLQVVVNQAVSERQARHTYEKFREVVRVYQGFELPLLGAVPADPRVLDAARTQQPLTLLGPDSAAAVAFGDLAERLLATAPPVSAGSTPLNDFWSRLTGGELPAAVPAQCADVGAGIQQTTDAAMSVPLDLAERLTRLESGLASVVQELLHLRERPVQSASSGKAAAVEELRAAPSRPTPAVAAAKPQPDRRGGRRAGGSVAPGRFVRTARRATPIDALQLRRVVGRMLAKAIPVVSANAEQPLQVAVDQMQVDADNDFSLRPGRYTRFSLHCQRIESPDNFVEEIFENCAISGCKVRHLGSQARYWVTSGRDGCILLDGDASDRHCVQVYMAAGGNSLLEEQGAAEEVPAVPALRRLNDVLADGRTDVGAARALPVILLAKFPHQPAPHRDAEGEDLEFVRIMRRDRSPLLCAFHAADDVHALGPVRRPSPERAF